MSENKHVFTASRLTSGNSLFPVRIEISPERLTRVKPHLIGSDEESIAISKVASVNIHTGLIWSDIRIDSTGGRSLSGMRVMLRNVYGQFHELPGRSRRTGAAGQRNDSGRTLGERADRGEPRAASASRPSRAGA